MTREIFVDQPVSAALRLAYARAAVLGPGTRVRALEPTDGGRPSPIEVAQFFAGELWTEQGECVALASYRLAGPVSCVAADMILARTPLLAAINEQLGRNTLRLVLAKRCWGDARHLLVRMLTARALGGPGTTLVVRLPPSLPLEAIRGVVLDLDVQHYRERPAILGRALTVGRIFGGALRRRMRRRLAALTAPAPEARQTAAAVLVTHEDLLSRDRTIRSQPYWLDPDHADPARLRVYVLPTIEPLGAADSAELRAIGVHPLSAAEIGRFENTSAGTPLRAQLSSLELRILPLLLDNDKTTAVAAAYLFALLEQAQAVAACAHVLNIRCFIGGDPHMVQADAMAVVAQLSRIPLLGYQYSNLAAFSPPMCATADRFLLFAKGFEPIWNQHGVRPLSFATNGYPYDGAFARVRGRAEAIRRQLSDAGAKTVICYFDESVQHDRYGVISAEAHKREIQALLRKLDEHPDWGLVVKSQFDFNSPSRLFAGDPLIERARATGRYLELRRGDRRNVVFPAEAALAADISIGHIIGATAPLESALAGRRSLMLDSHGQVRHRRELYDRAPIVFRSIDEALAAVERWRAGDPAASRLGDWSSIIGEMDEFRDGGASERLRAIVEQLANGAAA